ncbi:hypothetical protein NEHOM01_1647 [Nematocida homosporus]|uniref:uncharacterized protein n=1 Tax=Nematocida homosporus TaxID=1912981 RepID=UPI00221F68AC|nr:uncharacterized protein NEHOM01_1647 [Nematocida homosporus]KAI5186708.1 hypothetical protein NEHOM01_1647 [Nematocida homosporus]
MVGLWPKKLSWLKWVVVWLVVVLVCWLLKTYGVYDWVYARLIRKPSDAIPDNLAKPTNPTKPTKVGQDTQTEPITTLDGKQKKQSREKEEEVSSQPSPNTKLTQTLPPNPTTPDTPLVKCLQEIHMIKKHEDHEWAYDSNLSKWDLYLDEEALSKPAKDLRYLVLYTTDEIPASRCQEYIEQLSLLNKINSRIPVNIKFLGQCRGQMIVKLFLILLRIVEAPRLIVEMADDLFDRNSIKLEKSLIELQYLLKDVPIKIRKREIVFVSKVSRVSAKWTWFFNVTKKVYRITLFKGGRLISLN